MSGAGPSIMAVSGHRNGEYSSQGLEETSDPGQRDKLTILSGAWKRLFLLLGFFLGVLKWTSKEGGCETQSTHQSQPTVGEWKHLETASSRWLGIIQI